MTVVGVAKRAVQHTPLERPARAAFHAVSRTARRETTDNRNLALLLAFALRPDSCCVDVGANEGSVLDHMVRLAPRGRHVAFEPIPRLAEDLRARFPDVTVHQAAVSDRAGTRAFQHYPPIPAMSSLNGRPDLDPGKHRQMTVDTVTLDEALDGLRPDFVKIDVEGAEGLVLRGATETLERRPWVWFEHGNSTAHAHGSSAQEIYELLTRAGMRVFDAEGRGPYTLRQFQHPPRVWNFLAH